MKTLVTACQRHLPSESINKNFSLTINSVVEDGKRIYFEVLKKYDEPFNSNGETISERAQFENFTEALDCFKKEGGK